MIGWNPIHIFDMRVGFENVIDQGGICVMVIIPGKRIEGLSFGHFDGFMEADLSLCLGL